MDSVVSATLAVDSVAEGPHKAAEETKHRTRWSSTYRQCVRICRGRKLFTYPRSAM